MLKFGVLEAKILNGLLSCSPSMVAQKLEIDRQTVYNAKLYFRMKVQNGEEFLAVARSKYKPLLRRRLKTPAIMPVAPEDMF